MHMTKKTFTIAVFSVIGVALISWGILMAKIFHVKFWKPNYDKIVIGKYDIPEVPEGYALVFRETAEYIRLDGGSRKLTMSAVYDRNGRLLRKTEYNEKGIKLSEKVCSYNSRGSYSKETTYDDEGSVREIIIETGDANGNLTSLRELDDHGNEIRTETYEYYADGKRAAAEYTAQRGFHGIDKETINYTYYANGQRERALVTVYDDGETYQDEALWDEDGRLIKDYEDPGYTFSPNVYRYAYNEQGKLIKKEVKPFGYPDSEYILLEENVYADDGKLTKQTMVDDSWLHEDMRVSYYDKNENPVRDIIKKYDYQKKEYITDQETVFNYDKNGEFVKSVTTRKDGTVIEEAEALLNGDREYKKYSFKEDGTRFLSEEGIIRFYGEQENIKKRITYTETGEIEFDYWEEHDADGNLTRRYKSGTIYDYEDYTVPGNPRKTIARNTDGTIRYIIEKEYDTKRGIRTGEKLYQPDEDGENGVLREYIHYITEYDDYDNRIRYTYHDNEMRLAVKETLYTPFVIPID